MIRDLHTINNMTCKPMGYELLIYKKYAPYLYYILCIINNNYFCIEFKIINLL